MRGIRSLVFVALVLSVGCGGKAAPAPAAPSAQVAPPAEPPPAAPIVVELDALPTIPSAPQGAPASLLATATVGDVQAWIGDLATYANAVRPGTGALVNPAMLVQQLAGWGIDLRGVDLTRPIRVFALDPQEPPCSLVFAVAVADEAALREAATAFGRSIVVHDTWAAIGTPDALRAAAPYALTTAVSTAVPRELTVTVNMAATIARFRPLIDAWMDALMSNARPSMDPSMQDMMRKYVDGLAQFERIELSVIADRDRATLTTTLVPGADGLVARFVAQQRPAGFALLERVGAAPVVFGGRIDHTETLAAVFDSWLKQTTATYGANVATVAATLFSQWGTMMSGEHAMAVSKPVTGMEVSALWDTAVGSKVEALVLDYIAAIAGNYAAKVKPRRTTYRGVRQTSVDVVVPALASLGSPNRPGLGDLYVAAPGKTFAVAFGPAAPASMRTIIDAVVPPKGRKTTVTPGLAAVLTAARGRGDSYVIATDLPGLAAMNDPTIKVPPSREHAAMTVGFGTGAIVVRATLPASQLAAVVP